MAADTPAPATTIWVDYPGVFPSADLRAGGRSAGGVQRTARGDWHGWVRGVLDAIDLGTFRTERDAKAAVEEACCGR